MQRGLQVHGLLVGKESSVPLSMICTHLHTFLSTYDPLSAPSLVGAGLPAAQGPPVGAWSRSALVAGARSLASGRRPARCAAPPSTGWGTRTHKGAAIVYMR